MKGIQAIYAFESIQTENPCSNCYLEIMKWNNINSIGSHIHCVECSNDLRMNLLECPRDLDNPNRYGIAKSKEEDFDIVPIKLALNGTIYSENDTLNICKKYGIPGDWKLKEDDSPFNFPVLNYENTLAKGVDAEFLAPLKGGILWVAKVPK